MIVAVLRCFGCGVCMGDVELHERGGYRYLRSSEHRSAGVAAESGFAIRRVRLRRPLPLAEGFAAVRTVLKALDRPLGAFCACELRCPAPLSEYGLDQFNRRYLGMLEKWGFLRDGQNPVARSDVCPQYSPPGAAMFHAFCVTVPQPHAGLGTFVTSGSSCAMPQIVANDSATPPVSPATLRTRAEQVVLDLEKRMQALGFCWQHATATQLYTVHDFQPFMVDVIERRGAASGGLTWHLARPPMLGMDYQMDVRGIAMETIL